MIDGFIKTEYKADGCQTNLFPHGYIHTHSSKGSQVWILHIVLPIKCVMWLLISMRNSPHCYGAVREISDLIGDFLSTFKNWSETQTHTKRKRTEYDMKKVFRSHETARKRWRRCSTYAGPLSGATKYTKSREEDPRTWLPW